MEQRVKICWANEQQRRLLYLRQTNLCMTLIESHIYSNAFFSPQLYHVYCVPRWISGNPNTKLCNQCLNHLPSTTSVINPDFFPCPFLHVVVVVVITIIQQCQALSVKPYVLFHPFAWGTEELFLHILPGLSFFSFFFPHCLKMPVGLNCSNALSYELPALSFIYWIYCPIYFFFLSDKLKEKCRLSSSQWEPRDFKRIQENIGSNK